jgi:DNA-binding CsgD family transcriptional regulator/tetratricopeptide (TPR) repeat protein
MRLLEREAQLRELHTLLQGAVAGDGCLVAVGGEAGSGKTSLVRQFMSQVEDRVRVLAGACDALSSPRPLGPLFDVAPRLDARIRALLRGAEHRADLFSALLDDLAGPVPTLFVIEDAHWADEATLDLLRFLGRRIDGTRALLLVTWRDDEVSVRHPLQRVLGDLATSASVHRLNIPPLSESAVQALAAGSGIDGDELYRHTGGNAFYVTEVLGAGTVTVPATVRDAVLTRAARLSPGGRAVLDAAAIIGVRSESWLLAAVVPGAIDLVDECLDVGLLQADGDAVQFRHQLAQEAVLDAISPLKRTDLHTRVLATLRQRVATVADYPRLAHHAEAAGDIDAVLAYATEAGRRASRLGSHREAVAQFSRALRHCDHLPPDARADILAAWLPEGYALGELRQCIDVADQLIAIARDSGDLENEAKWRSWKSKALVMDGHNAEGDAEMDLALQLLEPLGPSPVHAEVWQTHASMRMLNRDYDLAISWGERTLALAECFDLPHIQAGALNAIGSSRLVGIDEEQGRADLERGLAIARSGRLDTQVASILGNLGSGHGEIYRFAQAERYLEQGIAFTRELDLDGYHWYQRAWLALTYMFQGRWGEAADLASLAVQSPAADTIARIMALVALGRVRARRGDPDTWDVLDEALELAIPTGTLQRLAPVHAARTEAAWLAGQRDRALAEACAVYEMAVRYRHPWHIGELGYWRWTCGDLDASPEGAAEPYRLQMQGDPLAAAAAWSDLGCPYEAARAQAESNDEDALREAFAAFDRLGARPAAQFVATRLRALGHHVVPRGVRASTRSDPDGLTRREREVLDLVAAGCTNATIADRLYLSPKTVERHLSSILGKLGAGSRHDAVRIAHLHTSNPQPGG